MASFPWRGVTSFYFFVCLFCFFFYSFYYFYSCSRCVCVDGGSLSLNVNQTYYPPPSAGGFDKNKVLVL